MLGIQKAFSFITASCWLSSCFACVFPVEHLSVDDLQPL